MAISDDWNIDFINKVISHIDGTLDYDTSSGTVPSAGDVIRGNTGGALIKIISIADSAPTGTITVTDTNGRFSDSEGLTQLDYVDFDTVVNNGFSVGDTVTGATSTRTGVIRKIEYNLTTSTGGRIWGAFTGGAGGLFTNNEDINVSATARASANGTGSGDLAWTAAVNEATGTITPPTDSDCVIINYDGGTELMPRFCTIQNTDTGSPTKTAVVQKVYGVTLTGSLRIIDTTGTAWADDDPIYVRKIPFDNVETGQKFKVGDKVVFKATGASSTDLAHASGKVISVESAKIVLQKEFEITGPIADNNSIWTRTTEDTKIALVNTPAASDFQDLVAAVFVNGAQPDELVIQLATQGGIYNGGSLNIIRDSNSLYTFLQDQFDELAALDDEVPISAQVALQQFTLINSWKIPDLSYRFVESGSIQDEALDNIWTNYQTLGTVAGIGDDVYAATTPLPQFYIEQDGSVLSAWWYYGHIDVLVKVKTNSDPTLTATADGVLINSGTVTIFNRNYTHTYDHFQTTTIAGVAPVPLATSADSNNGTGTHEFDYTLNTGTFVVDEEIVDDLDPTKRGIITVVGTVPDNLQFIQTGTTPFASADNFTGQTSGATGTADENQQNLVAGYGTRIVIATIDYSVAGTLTTAGFVGGETVTAGGGGAGSAIFMGLNAANTTIYLGNATSDFSIAAGQTLTGSVADPDPVFTASAGQVEALTIDKDIEDGGSDQPYKAVIFLNRDDQADGDTLAHMYEWVKFRTRSLETTGEPEYDLLGGPGSASGVQGRIYITLSSTYPLVKVSPLGSFAGGTFFGAQGVFVEDMANADIRSYQLIDHDGDTRNPPNTQTLAVTGVLSGDRVAVFRTSGGNIQNDEFTVGTLGSGNNESGDTQILVATGTRTVTPLPYDIPATGVIRVRNATTLLYESYDYTAVDKTTNIFTISPALSADLTFGENVFVPLIEDEATTTSVTKNIEYKSVAQGGDGDVSILTRVRRKGILPFEVSGLFGSSGASVAAIRTFDSIVD
jgi:hypothetical protein